MILLAFYLNEKASDVATSPHEEMLSKSVVHELDLTVVPDLG